MLRALTSLTPGASARRRVRTSLACVCSAVAVIVALQAPTQAHAETTAGAIRIVDVDSDRHPTNRIEFIKDDDSTKLPNFTIDENGQSVSNVSVYAGKPGTFENNPQNVIMLAIDASNSMKGAKFDNAKSAALKLLEQAKHGDRIGVVTFGDDVDVLVPPTDDMAVVRAGIGSIELTEGTAMNDAVTKAAQAFPDDSTRRVIVLLSDGADVGSNASVEDAIMAATNDKVEIFSVGIAGSGFDPATLEKLALETSGEFSSATSSSDLEQVYATLGQQLLRGYWLEYESSQPGGETVKLELKADGYDTAVATYRTPQLEGSDGAIEVSAPQVVADEKPLFTLPRGDWAALAAALPAGLLLAFLGWAVIAGRGQGRLITRIDPYTKNARGIPSKTTSHQKRASGSALMAPLYRVTDSVLGKSSLFAKLRRDLERANLPLREVELLYLMLAVGLVGGMLMWLFAGSTVALVTGPALVMLPWLWVKNKSRRRRKAFEDQLPDVLSTIAASLKAGHSFNQSITAVIKEAPDPTAHELQRVLTEARLGLPIEDALEAMATRMASSNFEFAVTTVNIQRTVGGSLSEILDMVAETVRGRQQFRQKVKALTGMGRMSAYVLLGMPIFIGGVLVLMNGAYMEPLLATPLGHKLLMVTAVFMALGGAMCQKIVSFKI